MGHQSQPPELERRKILIAWSPPARLRLESEEPLEITLFHDNGMASYRKGLSSWATGPANELSGGNDALRRGKAMARIGLTDYAAIKHNLGSAHVLRQEEVAVDGVSVPCTVIEAKYGHGETRTLWVDTARYAVLREVHIYQGSGPTKGIEVEHTIEVQRILWNNPPPEDLFNDPKMPSGVRLADGSVTPGPRGIVPSTVLKPCRNPLYTPEARLAHLRGSAGVAFTIDAEGKPTDIHIEEPIGLGLDEQAIECIAESRYTPATQEGAPIRVKSLVTVPFNDNVDSFWQLKRAIFHPEDGASRPTFRKAAYPARLPGLQVTGRADVHVRLTIGKDGLPHDIQATFKSVVHPEMVKEAAGIVAAWRFHPGEKDGGPVAVAAEFDLAFNGGDPVIRIGSGPVQ